MLNYVIGMMKKGNTPSVIGTTSGGTMFGTGSIAPQIPSCKAGDILILCTESGSGEPVTAPAGWTDLGVPTGNGISQLGVFWKRATADENGSNSVTVADSGDHTSGWVMAVTGVIKSGNPWNAINSNTNIGGGGTSSLTITGVTTTVRNCLIIGVLTSNSGTAGPGYSGWANAGLSSVTEQLDKDSGSPAPVRHLGAVSGIKASPGATGDFTVTFINNSSFGGQFCGALIGE